jgi:hypothetical protein
MAGFFIATDSVFGNSSIEILLTFGFLSTNCSSDWPGIVYKFSRLLSANHLAP